LLTFGFAGSGEHIGFEAKCEQIIAALPSVGCGTGFAVGVAVGTGVGTGVAGFGVAVGATVGTGVAGFGVGVGATVGGAVGAIVGAAVGATVGAGVGTGRPIGDVGVGDGVDDGRPIGGGDAVGAVGAVEGIGIGAPLGTGVDGAALGVPKFVRTVAIAAGVGDADAAVVTTTRTGETCWAIVAGSAEPPPPPLQPETSGTSAATKTRKPSERIVVLPNGSMANTRWFGDSHARRQRFARCVRGINEPHHTRRERKRAVCDLAPCEATYTPARNADV
jgi:hypothetical protein